MVACWRLVMNRYNVGQVETLNCSIPKLNRIIRAGAHGFDIAGDTPSGCKHALLQSTMESTFKTSA